jgi:hypothetical protein
LAINNDPFLIHQYDEYGYYTGASKTTTPTRGIPFRWSRVPLPEIPEGKFARLNGNEWVIEDERYTPPPPVPESVTPRQARLALHAIGKLSDVENALESLSEPEKTAAKIEWEYATAIERYSPLVLALTPALGLSEDDMDQLFIQAATL